MILSYRCSFRVVLGTVGMFFAATLFFIFWTPNSARAVDNEECLSCHNPEILKWSKEERESSVEPAPEGTIEKKKYENRRADLTLSFDLEGFKKSAHQDMACTDCHADIEETPHLSILEPVDCATCHEETGEEIKDDYHFKKLQAGDMDVPLCQDCHGAHNIRPMDDPESWVNPVNQVDTCGACHADEKLVKKHGILLPGIIRAYRRSIHSKSLLEGKKSAACSDCHESHSLKPLTDQRSRIYRLNISTTCGKCHQEVTEVYDASIHGQSVARGSIDSPTCTGCHGEHDILPHTEPTSPVYATLISKTGCPRCHEAERIVRKYGMPSGQVKSYLDSYHGLIDQIGSTTTANCASCHGVHNIFPSSDPRSTVYPDNLKATCGKCHPGATENFARGRIHVPTVTTAATTLEQVKRFEQLAFSDKVILAVRIFYYILIPLTLGFMLLHNGLDYLTKVRAAYRRHKKNPLYLRMTRNEVLQHMVLMISFTLLIVTGFALWLKFSIPGISGDSMELIRRWGHRLAAVAFTLLAMCHAYYIFFTARGREKFLALMPRWKDLGDMLEQLLFYLGIFEKRARFDRYNYVEKMEYLALLWGSIIMVVTGFMLWFETETLRYLPKWILDVAGLVHFYEAILATGAIIIWHFYAVHFNPDVSPMSMVWLTGTLTEEEMKHEHPLEYERIQKEKMEAELTSYGSGTDTER
ncbi:MAG: cytochrome c3 family protein [Deltaproteobacteria bacterium]|nr:cytochrome c3 family protein [Deltaproteobacteria bacterium]